MGFEHENTVPHYKRYKQSKSYPKIMVRVFLIRVGMDSEYGGFVSPIFPDESYVFVSIPNLRTWGYQLDASSKGLRCYTELKTNSDQLLTDFLPKDKLTVCGKPVDDVVLLVK